MAFETDLTKLGWFDRTLDSCEVITIPAGSLPKFIKVKLPTPDEPVIDVYWSGLPHLIVGSLVSVRRSPGNMAQYTVAGGGTGTATPIDHTHPSNQVILPVVGTPINTTLTDDFTARGSAGVIDGTLTYVTVGSTAVKLSVIAGDGYIRTTNDQQGALVLCRWAAAADLYTFSAPAAGQENVIFIGIEYSGGSVAAVTKANFSDWNWFSNFPLARASYDGTTMRIANLYAHSEDVSNFTRKVLRLTMPFTREEAPEGSGGLEISDVATRQLAMTAGRMWHGFNSLILNAIAAGATFYTYYPNGAGGFVSGTATQWENTQYSDGTTLQAMTANRYGTRWIYLDVSGNTVGSAYDGSLAMIYGSSNATSVALAQAEGAPSLPDHLRYHGRLIGRIIFQKSAAVATLVESAWTATFVASTVGDHTLLSNLNSASYYHLTNAEYTDLTDGGATTLHSHAAGGWPYAHTLTVSATDPDAQYSTIAAAIAAASAGDVILVDAGTYTEQLTVALAITLMALDRANTIITSASSPTITITAGATLKNLTITNSASGAAAYAVEVNGATGAILDHCTITKASGTPTIGAAVHTVSVTGLILRECIVSGTAGTSKYGVYNDATTSTIDIYGGSYFGTTNDIRLTDGTEILHLFKLPVIALNSINSTSPDVYGMFQDATGQIFTQANTRLTLGNSADVPPLAITPRATAPTSPSNNDLYLDTGANTVTGSPALRARISGAWVDLGNTIIKVKNTSGATVSAGDVGYLTSLGELATSTTSGNFIGTEVAVVIGGANNADIFVTKTGRMALNYTGSAPASGDFLIQSTTAGKVVTNGTAMHPGLLAIAAAAGSGGTVAAELFMSTNVVDKRSTTGDVVRILSAPNSDFVALINAGGSGGLTATNVPYDTVSAGAEAAINITSSIGKLVLWNSTRSTGRLISSVTTGSDFITTVSSTDAWADNDSITIRSQTTVEPSPPPYFMEIDLSVTQTDIPALARAILVDATKNDTGAANQLIRIHPYLAYNSFLVNNTRNYVANQTSNKFVRIPLYNRRFCWSFQASGASSSQQLLNLQGYEIATP
jgi:hypothetical protein